MPNQNSCPICTAGPIKIELDITAWDESEDLEVVTLTVGLDGAVVADKDVPHDGSDAFIYASCSSCGIALAGEPGDTRLRRATAVQTVPGTYADDDDPEADITDEQREALFALVYRAIDTPLPA